MNTNFGDDPYENLALAIVAHAAEDYCDDLIKLKRNPRNKEAKDDALQLENFFHSHWYQMLTQIDGDFMIRKLREKVAG
jgi:hypothetical protein